MKILRTRENGRPHPRAKEKLGSLSRPSLPLSFRRFLSPPSPSFSFSPLFFPPVLLLVPTRSVLARAHATTDMYYMDANVGGENWWARAAVGGRGLIPVPRGSRSAPHLGEGAAASQTFRAETRFLTGNFVRLRLPPPSAAASSSAVARPSLESSSSSVA